jgi:hypothetical protein
VVSGSHDGNSRHLKSLSSQRSRLTFSSFAIILFITALLADSLLSDVSRIVNQNLNELTRIAVFSIIAGVALFFGILVIANDTKRIRIELGSKNRILNFLSRAIKIIQYAIIGLLISLTIQIIFTSQYLNLFFVSSLGLSWLTGATIMGMMSFKFLQWYRTNRNILVLLYLISSLIICFVLTTASIPSFIIMTQEHLFFVNATSIPIQPFQASPQDPYSLIVSMANWLVIPLSLIVWIATAIMLKRYSNTIGQTRYWLMLSVPLLSVVIGDIALIFFLPNVNTIFDQEVIIYTMIVFGGMITESFLLGFAFITISKSIQDAETNITTSKSDLKINDYLSISARGIPILFVCFFANPSAGSYLPFGLVASSFLAFGAYLFFSGIYSSAISISHDLKLRHLIRKSLLDQSGLLDNIALADMNTERERQTIDILRRQTGILRQETGLDPFTSESDIRDYLNKVVSELKKERSKAERI